MFRYAFALLCATAIAACSTPAGDVATFPGCETPADCDILKPGVCGVLACDVDGLIGAPSIAGVPHGCYVGVNPTCEAHADGGSGDGAPTGIPCVDVGQCPDTDPCAIPVCANMACQFAYRDDGTLCGDGGTCSAGVCH